MAVYYISACHDCKVQLMWEKCPEETAEIWHKDFHKGHETILYPDTDEDLDYSLMHYKHLGIFDEWTDKT